MGGLAFSAAPQFRAGFAERDITPRIGMQEPGGYQKRFHRSVHDPCKVRAAVFDDGARRVALVSVDALMVPRQLVVEIRREVQSRCAIAPEAVLIGATHSHSSGPTGMTQPGEYDHASPLARKLAYEISSSADPEYLAVVRRETIQAVCDAHAALSAARAGAGSGVEDKAAFNRRFRMRNGLSYTHPGQGNPDIVEPAGPIDPQVGVVGVWRDDGRLIGCIVNYACHATTSPGGISANWIYYLEKTIRGALSSDAVVLFLQGASGDVTQVDNRSPYAQPNGEEYARLVGGRVGAEVVKVLLSMQPGALAPLDAASVMLRFNRRKPSADRVKKSYEMAAKDRATVDLTEWIFAKEIVLLDAKLAKEPTAEAEVQAIQVGPAVFVTNPAEFFCELGLRIKAGSPFPLTFPVELANGCVGYVPTGEALSSSGGGYETRLTSYSNLEIAAGNRLVEAGVQLARRMHPGKLPTRPLAKPYKAPWTYGNVPPETK
jgi:neutral ceramidase